MLYVNILYAIHGVDEISVVCIKNQLSACQLVRITKQAFRAPVWPTTTSTSSKCTVHRRILLLRLPSPPYAPAPPFPAPQRRPCAAPRAPLAVAPVATCLASIWAGRAPGGPLLPSWGGGGARSPVDPVHLAGGPLGGGARWARPAPRPRAPCAAVDLPLAASPGMDTRVELLLAGGRAGGQSAGASAAWEPTRLGGRVGIKALSAAAAPPSRSIAPFPPPQALRPAAERAAGGFPASHGRQRRAARRPAAPPGSAGSPRRATAGPRRTAPDPRTRRRRVPCRPRTRCLRPPPDGSRL
ncbi:hypothetical protein U9M48_028916 [Paspalum notatum var. saurae]|uniref:Uncharacterized protein n=1 Tax=Paspalum notatum var. saurae TaxID=547442 RepID=A0AAQ3X285_PASNO